MSQSWQILGQLTAEPPMKTKILWRVVLVAALAFMGSSPALAQAPPHTRVDGLIHDFTAALDAAGPWEISGEFSLALNAASAKWS